MIPPTVEEAFAEAVVVEAEIEVEDIVEEFDTTVLEVVALADAVVDVVEAAEEFDVTLSMALALNVANWFPGLIAKTMPCSQ